MNSSKAISNSQTSVQQLPLKTIVKKYFLDEKVFIVPHHKAGQQISRALALGGDRWVNLRPVMVRDLVLELLRYSNHEQAHMRHIALIEHEALFPCVQRACSPAGVTETVIGFRDSRVLRSKIPVHAREVFPILLRHPSILICVAQLSSPWYAACP